MLGPEAGSRYNSAVRIEESFSVDRQPEAVFDYLTDPANLRDWQTAKTSVEQLTDGPPALGTRVRERTKPPGGREFEQIVEYTEFERPRRVRVQVVEGPLSTGGTWSFEPDGDGTRVRFATDAKLPGPLRLLEPVMKRVVARRFARYHGNLRRNLELGG